MLFKAAKCGRVLSVSRQYETIPSSLVFNLQPVKYPYFPSIKVFSNESALCIRWPRFWSLNFSIRPSDEYSKFDLLAIQGSLKSLLQDSSSKASIQCSAFFIVQLLHVYMTTRNTIVLTVWTFVSKVMSLLFNMPSRFVIAFLPRSKHLLISCLQSPCLQ